MFGAYLQKVFVIPCLNQVNNCWVINKVAQFSKTEYSRHPTLLCSVSN